MAPSRARTTQNVFMELRKTCQHSYLAAPELENRSLSLVEQHRLLVQSSGKLAFLKLLLPKLKERDHRVLLFSQFKIALDWIQDFLQGEGYQFLRLDGDIQQAQRQKSMDAYNAPGSEYFIFLLTTRAGGVGINLATADTVIVYDPDFNPHQDLQAIARSHRYGQTKKVLVFKLMTKDSIEEQIVYNGKKKMVLDHLVVQNLGKDNEEEDVTSMLLAGAKALYATNADGTSASDINYTPKQVEEMIDKVEKQAEEEAVLLKEKWEKEDAMTEDERLAALTTKGSETMNFAFAKIWEMDKGGLQEVEADPAMEQRLEDEMEDNWMTVWENAEKERKKREEEEAIDRKERRKKIDYTLDNTTPKKKIKAGRPKGSKKSGSKSLSREPSTIQQFQSSDSEFHIGTEEVSGDDTDLDLDTVPENVADLTNTVRAGFYNGLLKKKKSELNKMERKALRKYLEEEMIRKAKELQKQSEEAQPSIAGPSTEPITAPNPTGPVLVTSGQATTPVDPRQSSSPTKGSPTKSSDRLAEWVRNELKKKDEAAAERRKIRIALMQSMQEAMDENPAPHPESNLATVPGPSGSSSRHTEPLPLPEQHRPTPPVQPSNPAPASRMPALVQIARSATAAEIALAQDTIKWLWQQLQEFGLRRDVKAWGRMVLPEVDSNERKQIYARLAKTVDRALRNVGHPEYFSNPKLRHLLEVLFESKEPGVPPAPTGGASGTVAQKMPIGVGRLVNGGERRPLHLDGNRHLGNGHGNINGNGIANGQNAGPSRPPIIEPSLNQPVNNSFNEAPPTAIARPAAPLQTPQQRAALARSAISPANPAQAVMTQPRAPPIPPLPIARNNQANQSSSNLAPTSTAHFPCPFCGSTSHSIHKCPDRAQNPLVDLRARLQALGQELATRTIQADQRAAMVGRFRDIQRKILLQENYERWQTATGVAPSSPSVTTNPIARPATDGPSMSGSQPQSEPVFGLALPARFQQRLNQTANSNNNGSATLTSVPLPQAATTNGNAPGISVNHYTGRTKDDAIAIDDDSDPDTAGPSTAASMGRGISQSHNPGQGYPGATGNRPPGPQSHAHTQTQTSAPGTSTYTVNAGPQWTAGSSDHNQVQNHIPQPASIPPPTTNGNGPTPKACPMCRKFCGMDVRSCAERHGGRQALKDKIKRLQPASDDEQVAEVMAALYEVYKVWPRDETPRKRVKREV